MRGIFTHIGFRQCIIEYDRDVRYAGKTKYPFRKMLGFAVNAMLSFSASPIKTITWLSFVLWGSSLIYLGKSLVDHFVYKVTCAGVDITCYSSRLPHRDQFVLSGNYRFIYNSHIRAGTKAAFILVI